MQGYGDNEVILFPGGVVAIRMAKVTDKHPQSGPALSDDLVRPCAPWIDSRLLGSRDQAMTTDGRKTA
jgi:hypothetical protein